MESTIHKNYRNSGNWDVLKFIQNNSIVLDVGCGGGDNAKILKERNCDVDGITISETELMDASTWLRHGYLHDLEKGLPVAVKNNLYDYVICSHVLEHICYPNKLLADIKECLNENGSLIVALPNIMHYKSRWKLVKGQFNYQPAGVWDNTHFKWYTFSTGASLLTDNGFVVKEKTVTGQLPGASFFSKLLPVKLADALYDCLKKLSPGLLGYQLLYLAEKKLQ